MTYTIAQAVPFFVQLDKASFDAQDSQRNPWDKPVDREARTDKALRNITQRYPVPVSGSMGRADLYSLSGIMALRLIYNALDFGLKSYMIRDYALWLGNSAANGAGPSLIEEAINRVRSGEDFAFHVVCLENMRASVYADWQYPNVPWKDEVGRFTAPASAQIRALLALMDPES